MNSINGSENELEFVKYFNNRKISELNPMCRQFIENLFYITDENLVIKCWKNKYKQKSDIFIKINKEVKGISIKKGIKNSVHVERISDFIHFLIENKVDRNIVIEYLKYHYADGSTNGKGEKRVSVEEYKKANQESINKINMVFKDENILKNAIDKFVIKGNNSTLYISALVYGEINDFIWITADDIKKVILRKKDIYLTGVHFGPLVCQPKNRCLNYNSKYEKDRFCVQIKWYSLFDDIIENMNNNVTNNI